MKLRVVLCGDREWFDKDLIRVVLSEIKDEVECVIEGEARGADLLGRSVAEELGIPVISYPADWDTYGKAAGAIRNRKMLQEGKPTLVLAFHDTIETSRGTKDMCRIASKAGIEVRIIGHKRQ